MFSKEYSVQHEGHTIALRNSYTPGLFGLGRKSEAKLYIDGAKMDSSDEPFVFNANYPFLRAALKKSDGTSEEVAVYVKTGFWTSKVKICVGGKIVFNKGF